MYLIFSYVLKVYILPFFLELLFKIISFIYSLYLILAVLGLCCCMGFSLTVMSRGYA